MLRQIFRVIFLLAIATTAFAGGSRPDQEQEQGQHQGQEQGQEQYTDVDVTTGAVTTEATIAEGAVQVNNVREAQGDYKVDFRNNPNVYTNPPMPTVPCYKTGGLGASGGGVGLSLGGGKIDPYCTMREEIRLGHAIGLEFQAMWMWCNMENVTEIFGTPEECLQANTSRASPEYQLLYQRHEELRNTLEETERLLLARCQQAEEGQERVEGLLNECLRK